METLEGILKEHPFFTDLKSEFIQLLVGCAANRRYEAGQFFCRKGEQADEFFLIRKGMATIEIDVRDGQSLVLQTIGAGDILGWSWLLPPYYWHFDSRAQEETRVIVLDGKCIRTKCETNHTLGYELLKRFAKIMESRLEATRLQLIDVYGKP